MPKVTINGTEYEAADGETIIEVADRHGIDIPRFCYHPGLTVAGNCRICLVDVEKAPKPMIACGTPVMDGMVVNTDNEKTKWAREGVMEFLLLNHPLDCPICDKAGECMLQWFSVEHGPGRSRLVGDKEHFKKRQDIGEHIMLDQERCILCSRCVRFTDEITKTQELGIFERGVSAELNVLPGKRLDNHYSGCVTDICPVGALTLKEFRFQSRVWFLKNTPSICPGCSRGCNVNLAVNTNMNKFGGRIERVTPRTNTDVNDYWICDTGRLIYQGLRDRPRLLFPQVRNGSSLERKPWDAAAGAAWEGLHAASEDDGTVGAVLSAACTNEEIHLVKRLMDSLGGGPIAFPEHVEGEDDGILLNADRTPNRRGARALCGEAAVDGTALEAIRAGVADGTMRGLLVVGENLAEGWELGRLQILVAMDQSGTPEMLERAHVVLPLAVWAEMEGTWVNAGGRLQRLRAAVRPTGEVRAGWKIASMLGARAGWEETYSSPEAVLDEITESVAAFRGLSWNGAGMLGMPLPDEGGRVMTDVAIEAAAKVVVFMGVLLTCVAYMVWVERKVSSWMQRRVGPNRVGPLGLLQPAADGLKFILKEDIIPTNAYKPLFILAPLVTLVAALAGFAVIPFGSTVEIGGRVVQLAIADINVGVLYVLALGSLNVYGLMLAGWSSGSKYSLLGGLRASAQVVSYELAMGLSIVGIFMVTGSLRLSDMVAHQAGGFWHWNLLTQPLAALVFLISAFAETNRLPFDLPEAETELVAGYHTEYSSMKFAMFFMAEYAHMVTVSSLMVLLFLGGWHLPFLDVAAMGLSATLVGIVHLLVFAAKVALLVFLFVWVRWTLPRFRYDQLMTLGWKVLFPITLVNIAYVGLGIAMGLPWLGGFVS